MDPSRELQPSPLGSMVVHRVPAPMDPSRELQPSPLGSMVVHHAGPAFADVHPMFADVCIRSPNVCRRLHTSGPVGVDHSMELQPGPLGSIEGTASSPLPWDPSRELHRVPARSSNQSRPPWNRLRELHRVPAHGSKVVHTSGPGIHGCASSPGPAFADVCIMLARSALITRWNSNQVPWHPSRELHRVPARSSNQSRPPWITRWNSNPARPMDPWLCIMLAHGSKVVHTSGPWIQGCASCWPMDPRLCIMLAPVGSKVVHHAGPRGIHRGNCIESPPVGIASCWPGRR